MRRVRCWTTRARRLPCRDCQPAVGGGCSSSWEWQQRRRGRISRTHQRSVALAFTPNPKEVAAGVACTGGVKAAACAVKQFVLVGQVNASRSSDGVASGVRERVRAEHPHATRTGHQKCRCSNHSCNGNFDRRSPGHYPIKAAGEGAGVSISRTVLGCAERCLLASHNRTPTLPPSGLATPLQYPLAQSLSLWQNPRSGVLPAAAPHRRAASACVCEERGA